MPTTTGNSVTVTVRRPDQDITIEMQWHEGAWWVITALDEYGDQVQLTQFEKANVKARARLGEDEHGR